MLCDASGCYWDGYKLQARTADDFTTDWMKTEWMKDVIIDEIRWHHIYRHLVEHPSAAMILRDSLHYPGHDVPVSDETAKSRMLDSEPTVGRSKSEILT